MDTSWEKCKESIQIVEKLNFFFRNPLLGLHVF